MIDLKLRYKTFLYNRRRLKELNDLALDEGTTFLVSYPKSGNSWMRSLLGNVLKQDPSLEIGFHNLGDFLPDSHNKKQRARLTSGETPFSKMSIKVVKSHDRYKSFYKGKKVIYLLRDGYHVIPSYYHYKNARSKVHISMADIAKGKGIHSFGSWYEHVMGWLNHFSEVDILLVRYEHLRKDTLKELVRIKDFLGLEVDSDRLKLAIEQSSFENMKVLESKHGYFNDTRKDSAKDVAFVRKGEVAKEKTELPSDLVKIIQKQQEQIELKLKQLK